MVWVPDRVLATPGADMSADKHNSSALLLLTHCAVYSGLSMLLCWYGTVLLCCYTAMLLCCYAAIWLRKITSSGKWRRVAGRLLWLLLSPISSEQKDAMFLTNVNKGIPDYTASHYGWLKPLQSPLWETKSKHKTKIRHCGLPPPSTVPLSNLPFWSSCCCRLYCFNLERERGR
jgi:hypothetical protein